MKKHLLIAIIIAVFTLNNISAQDRIYFEVENEQVLYHLENTFLPAYFPNGEFVYWQFTNLWSFTDFPGRSEIILDSPYEGLANAWSYGYINSANENMHFNMIATESNLHGYYSQEPFVNIGDIFIFRADKLLPDEHD